jgi:hypothetical protein
VQGCERKSVTLNEILILDKRILKWQIMENNCLWENSGLAQFGRKIIYLYLLAKKLQNWSLNTPKTTSYEVVKVKI